MKVAILYHHLLDRDGNERTIGGVQTYLFNLAHLCQEMGWEPLLFQYSNKPFNRLVDDMTVKGIPCANLAYEPAKRALFQAAASVVDLDKNLLVFGADHGSVRTNNRRCVSIQHGVFWDLPMEYLTRKHLFRHGLPATIRKLKFIRDAIRYFENCMNCVCVDYNFLNWYRAVVPYEPRGRIWVIPNFAHVMRPEEITENGRKNDRVRILFARRFCPYRGTRIMADATKQILSESKNVEFTFAGEGPDEQWLRSLFCQEERVKFIKYFPKETTSVCSQHDIAVIPSIASEGTSFSVAEAMGAGCAVLATAVGGITNMIIDGYNGLLVMPNAKSLETGLLRLVRDCCLRDRLRRRGHETAMSAFCVSKWKVRWRAVLEEMASG